MKAVCIVASLIFAAWVMFDLWDASNIQSWDFPRLTSDHLLAGVKLGVAFYFLQLAKMC